MNAALLQQRAELMAHIRSFFRARDVMEVTTPCVVDDPVSDVHLTSLSLASQPLKYLRTSPESAHKWLLAQGLGDLYELGPVFRAGEFGHHHQSEFMLLEWYRLGMDWRTLAHETADLVNTILATHQSPKPLVFRTWEETCQAHLGLLPNRVDIDVLSAQLPDQDTAHWSHAECVDYLYATRVQSQFEPDTITIVHDYPADQAALAELSPDGQTAQRFEVFVGPVELANGYQELRDPTEQLRRFERDRDAKAARGESLGTLDRRLLSALEQGLPPCSGVALGVDRLVMIALGAQSISEVMACPIDHALSETR